MAVEQKQVELWLFWSETFVLHKISLIVTQMISILPLLLLCLGKSKYKLFQPKKIESLLKGEYPFAKKFILL